MATVRIAPETCPACGEDYTGGKVVFGWTPCDCPGAKPRGGHVHAVCERPGCGFKYLPDHTGPVPGAGHMPPLGRHGDGVDSTGEHE